MKQTPQEQAVTARMAPGVLSREGFLGEDRRPWPRSSRPTARPSRPWA